MNSFAKYLALMLVIMLSITMLSGCGNDSNKPSDNSATPGEKMMVANLKSEPKSIDPAINSATDGSTVIFNIFEGLTRISDDDVPEAGLAETWDVSDDGLKYVFHLRDGLKWSDGTDLTADDIKYGIIRVLDRNTASAYPYHAYCIKNGKAFYEGQAKAEDVGVKVIDEQTLEIELDYPVPYFMDVLSWHLLLPLKKDIVESDPDGWAQKPETLITNGPFRVAEWKHNEYILLEKNPYYWDKDNVKLDKVKLVMITDENTSLTAFKTGKVDYISNIPPVQLPNLIKSGEAITLNNIGPYFYALNVTKKPLDDARVRKALALAVDREAIVKTVTQGGEKPAVAFIPYGLPGVAEGKDFRDEGKKYLDPKGNVEEAKRLLAEAGYPDGKGFPELSLTYNTSDEHKAVAEAVQAMWKKNLGIDVGLTNQEWKVFLDTRKQGDFQMARHGYFADFYDPGSLFDLWVTGSPNNDAKYSNPEYDRLVEAASKEQDPAKRAQYYHDAEDILMEDMPIIPMHYYSQNYMLQPHIKNMHVSPLGWEFFRSVDIEK